jgi:TonB-linked SusC/RagA family outer membrane protein
MRKNHVLLMGCTLFAVSVVAQNRQVTGRITDSRTGAPVSGATIRVQGSNTAVVTANDGSFSISAGANARTLVISSVGYTDQQVSITSGSMNVQLVSSERSLDEVVVVGYGVKNRREVTGSVGKVSAADIADRPLASIDQALQGTVAGVQVTQNSGTPGGGISVRVRGSSSISASNQPLYVVDGVPMITGDFSQLGYGGQSVNSITDLNPSDIESLEVLKDASAAAIYGSRAANGVVLITTKRGKAQKTRINVNVYQGFQNAWRKPDYLDREEFLTIMKEALVNDGYFTGSETRNDLIDWWYSSSTLTAAQRGPFLFDNSINTDWVDEVFRTAAIKNYEMNVSGGDAKTKYYLGGGYFDQEGIVIGSRFRRWSGRLNLDHAVSEKLNFGTSISLSRSMNNRIVSDNTLYGPFANSLAAQPLWPVRFNGAYTRPNFFYSNPVAEGTENDDLAENLRGFGNVFATYKITSGLSVTGRAGFDVYNLNERRYTPNTYPGNSAAGTNGSATSGKSINTRVFYELTGNYKFTAGDHKFDILAGTNTETNKSDVTSVTGIGFPGEKFRFVTDAATVNTGSNVENSNAITSALARVYYSFKNKYLLDVNFRADYSSRFAPGERWGYFPGASFAWRIKEENFMKNAGAISDLKLRAGFGLLGNQAFGNFSYLTAYGGSNYNDQAGIAPVQLGNKDLTWEKTEQSNIGLDLGLFDRITLTADVYYKKTRDLLFIRPIPAQNGFGSYASNIGNVENRGLELALNTVNFKGTGGGLKWTTDFNISFNKNKVVSLFEGRDIFYGFGGNSIVLREGQPIGTFYGLLFDGVFSELKDVPAGRQAAGIMAGDANYRDLNGDGVITDDDRTIIGNAQPKFTGGITNTLSWRGLDLNVFAMFSYGNKIWNAAGTYQEGLFGGFNDDNQRTTVLARWQKPGDITMVPRATTDVSVNRNNEANTTRFIEDGSFLRIKNVVLGYTLPKSTLQKIGVSNVRIYAQAQNLFTFTKYKGFDPEVNFAGASNTTLGTDFYTFPQMRQITFGLNVGF